jgi:mono/diheme cytochrome c family protein
MNCIADLSLPGRGAGVRCAVRRTWFILVLLAVFALPAKEQSRPTWHEQRQLPSDLEIGGDLAGLAPGSTRYVTREELLALPQVSYTVSADANFAASTKITGVALDELIRQFGAATEASMAVAICDDRYLAPYPPGYIAAHHPVLVLTINGEPPERWPKAAEDDASDMGPYMISNPEFTPSFKVLAHSDEAQIPWGVVRIEFREEKAFLGAIAPQGPHANLRAVQDGFQIAAQNCFRCHNAGDEGGRKSGISWEVIAAMAALSPQGFAAYVRAPVDQNAAAQMPANPQYDEATLNALSLYFQTFASPPKPPKP